MAKHKVARLGSDQQGVCLLAISWPAGLQGAGTPMLEGVQGEATSPLVVVQGARALTAFNRRTVDGIQSAKGWSRVSRGARMPHLVMGVSGEQECST